MMVPSDALPNKPVLPTAPTTLNRYSLPSGRLQTGQSLDGGGED